MNPVVPGRPKTDGITLKHKYVAASASEESLNNLT
jgi:hypothetical protein